MKHKYDMVIRGGTIVDGSGSEPFVGDIAMRDGIIVEVGAVSGQGCDEIAASGMLVTPGFVDIHTHYDGQVTWTDQLSPSSLHGTTTVVMGNCGVGFAPCRPNERELLIEVMEGVEDIPGIVLAEGVPWKWESFTEYLDFLDERNCDVDFATQVPHGPVRIFVMGERGARREPATKSDMEKMTRLVKEGIEAGALGFSTARTLVHRRKDGTLAPTITAGEEELRAIALGLKEIDKGVLQMVDDFNDTSGDVSTEFEMWRRIATESGRPLGFALVQLHTAPERWRHLLKFMRRANEEGLTLRGQIVGRPIGVFLGLNLSSHPFVNCASYRKIAHLPLAERVAQMRTPELKAQILSEQPDTLSQIYQTRTVDDLVEFSEPLNYFPGAEEKLKNRAAALGVDAMELAYDLLLKNEGYAMLYHALANYASSSPDVAREMMQHPDTILALGDGGAHLGMICDASVSTHLLTYWVRDLPEADRLPLPWAIEALTSKPASSVGLLDRGLLKPGYKADLNIIDFEGLKLYSPRMVDDLPAGGRRLMQRADGYVATIVSGKVTYRDGKPTGEKPGRLIRGTQPAPELKDVLLGETA